MLILYVKGTAQVIAQDFLISRIRKFPQGPFSHHFPQTHSHHTLLHFFIIFFFTLKDIDYFLVFLFLSSPLHHSTFFYDMV